MSAPGEPLADLAKRSQEMVGSALQTWADTAQKFAGNTTLDPSNARAHVDTIFDFAEKVLAGQRAIAAQWMSVAGKASEGPSQQTAQATTPATDSDLHGMQAAAENTAETTRDAAAHITDTARIPRDTAQRRTPNRRTRKQP